MSLRKALIDPKLRLRCIWRPRSAPVENYWDREQEQSNSWGLGATPLKPKGVCDRTPSEHWKISHLAVFSLELWLGRIWRARADKCGGWEQELVGSGAEAP